MLLSDSFSGVFSSSSLLRGDGVRCSFRDSGEDSRLSKSFSAVLALLPRAGVFRVDFLWLAAAGLRAGVLVRLETGLAGAGGEGVRSEALVLGGEGDFLVAGGSLIVKTFLGLAAGRGADVGRVLRRRGRPRTAAAAGRGGGAAMGDFFCGENENYYWKKVGAIASARLRWIKGSGNRCVIRCRVLVSISFVGEFAGHIIFYGNMIFTFFSVTVLNLDFETVAALFFLRGSRDVAAADFLDAIAGAGAAADW